MALRIKEVIKEQGYTIEEAANKIGISRSGLNQHLNGNPSVEVLQRIAEALNVHISDLFEQPSKDTINCPYCGGKIKIEKG